MKIFLVGHRGTGKSSLLKRIQKMKILKAQFFDLDQEIENQFGNITELFQKKGEPYFRKCEADVFHSLFHSQISETRADINDISADDKSKENFFCALGAGFDLSLLDESDFVIWVRRESDKAGRIFLDRPRLNTDISPLGEYNERKNERERRFSKRANAIYTLPEGKIISESVERKILENILNQLPHVENSLLENTVMIQNTYLEVRSDQWNSEEILQIQNRDSINKIYAQRTQNFVALDFSKWSYLDWDIKYGPCRWTELNPEKLIISSHEDDIEKAITQLDAVEMGKNSNLKLCPLVQTWQELKIGYLWWKEQPDKRNFLPRSTDGRWSWFRLWMKGRQNLNFFRRGPGAVHDQPTQFQWLSASPQVVRFAAVLGYPVSHSFSPAFHSDFFSQKSIPFFAIPILESDFAEAMPFLQELGLSFAAVTSPLKKQAYLVCQKLDEHENSLESVNTLTWDKNNKLWIGNNTDHEAFAQSFDEACSLVEDFRKNPVAQDEIIVWGSGGTTNIIKSKLPRVQFIKARIGIQGNSNINPRVLIWASTRSSETVLPPENWKPDFIYDLSYQENSLGAELAQKYKSKYFSGTRMFELQALAQQKIWSQFL